MNRRNRKTPRDPRDEQREKLYHEARMLGRYHKFQTSEFRDGCYYPEYVKPQRYLGTIEDTHLLVLERESKLIRQLAKAMAVSSDIMKSISLGHQLQRHLDYHDTALAELRGHLRNRWFVYYGRCKDEENGMRPSVYEV